MPTAAFAPLLLLCTGLSLALTGLPSHAQSAAEAAAARQAEILQRQNQQRIQRDIDAARLPEPVPGGADTGTIAPAAGASLAQAGLACRDIRRIIISGASRSGHAAQQIVEGYAGRCLGVAEIEQILAAITRHYLEQGLATIRAYLPSQDLAGGVLEIQVVEGVVDRILLDEGARKSINPANVFPAPGALLNLRDFKQGIDQLNRLESNRPSSISCQGAGQAPATCLSGIRHRGAITPCWARTTRAPTAPAETS